MSLHLPVTFRHMLRRTRALECGLRGKTPSPIPAPTFLRLSHAVCGARRALLDAHLRAPNLCGSLGRRSVEVLAENGTPSKSSLAEMKRFLVEHGIRFERGYTCLILDCPACLFENNAVARHFGSAASFSTPKLYINLNTGTHLCHTCKRSGSWEMFQDLVCLLEKARIRGTDSRKKVALPKAEPGWIPTPQSVSAPKQEYDQGIVVTYKEVSESVADLCTRLGIRNLKLTTLHRYGARISRDLRRLLLPLYYVDGSLLGIHVVSAPEDEADCRPKIELIPRAVTCMLFGWPQVQQGSRKWEHVVITTSPLDAMAVSQETTIPALSLPNGTRSLPPEALPLLEPFTRVILWLGNDVIAWEASRAFSKKLNPQRCYLIGPKQEHDRPIVALRQGRGTLSAILKTAHPITHSAITSFSAMRDDVLLELSSPEKLAGVKWKRFPQLTRLLKGHRRGELTVFTGPTGSGKTTFISEYSLDLCMQGVCTLWGSFEIINVRLAKIMLTQFAQLPLERHLDRFDDFADRFEQLPLFFMTFHGQQGLKNAMMHAVYVHDIQHVVVDNLQFMMGHEDDAEAHDRFWKQDVIIAAFRRFATAQHCHVTLVIHPRKEKSDELNTSSIFGSAKASQEADNVVILQDKSLSMLRGRKYIQVTKNRFDGDLGVMPLQFDKETLSFSAKKRVKKQITSDASIQNSSEKVLEIPEN